MRNVIILHANGERTEYPQKTRPSYEFLRKLVDGPAELIPDFNKFEGRSCVVYCNELGKLQLLPRNEEATKSWRVFLDSTKRPYAADRATLVGTVVIIQKMKGELK